MADTTRKDPLPKMTTELQPAPTLPSLDRFTTVADEALVKRTVAALEGNGFTVLRAANAAEAKRIVLGLVPAGSNVHHGASNTLDVAGISAELDGSGAFDAVRPKAMSMDRAAQADEIRHLMASPDVMVGSVAAVTENGTLIAASASGSQLGPYVSGAGRVILVIGTQKIVADLDEGLRRVEEHVFPLEDARAQAAYGIHTSLNKILIVNRDMTPGRITVVVVDEALGF